MKAFLILATAAATVSAKVASSVLRQLEVDGKSDVFVRFADPSAALEAATLENKPLERQEVFDILSEVTTTGHKSIEAVTAGYKVTPTWLVTGAFIDGADKDLIAKLSLNKAIKSVEHLPDIELEPLLTKEIDAPAANITNQWGVNTVGAPEVWKNFNGKGVVIGSIDTGARHTHNLIKDSWRADRGWYDPYNQTALPEDLGGHGTHTIGTMTGKDGYGVAPGAQWIACRGLYIKSGSSQALMQCLQFMMCPTRTDGTHPDCSKGAHVINNSWGSAKFNPVYEEAVAALRKAGITPVFSNGNSGPACGTTGNPGTYPNVISVGAIGSYTDEPTKLAFFSSKGPGTYIDAHNVQQTIVKPTISAPGFFTLSAYNTGDSAVKYMAGTSMAAPHVAGVVALLKSAKIDLTYEEIYAYLTQTADQKMLEGEPKEWVVPNNKNGTDIYPGAPNCGGVDDTKWPNNRYGYGRVNVANILKDGKFVSISTPAPTTKAPAPEPVGAKFCTYKKTVLSEWNNQLFIDTIKNNKNEGFVIDLKYNIIQSASSEDGCLSLIKDATNTNSVALAKCTGDATQIWKFDTVAKRIVHPHNGECLDAFRDGDKFGLHTYACDATNANQKWLIDAAGHKIKHATHNNLCLDVDPTNPTHAAQVWECHDWNTNQWIDAVAY
ncbi:hypothetical protein SPRG_21856 [Saprolegnia parasitica CBS 223.65]|uniref:subtilisin n=1 Tax=Saprolegnia parasitica (strain CBS 223.65) TaxID=695850 RepID=A0A067BTB3_SAPPC|nr:hypothetical protein SPRG_21856 [Saprolegnia parasitica CBS 223.65]KDO17526.1 hypothetical protein SPRG_21856 [Saprolegnia parasitica CBS 223.65]|eukprot:XP_012211767.1 hypothetical protein SPRG_21856 [Saprolegnia parasitica CBS 223.65]